MASMPGQAAPHPGRRRFALLLEYDGTGFAGSQLQARARTVQGVLEEAIGKVSQEETRVAFAGRTDAGVHAVGQVASFLSDSALSVDVLFRALNATLPADVAVRQVAEVDVAFDPRRHAVSRHYRYLIDNGHGRSALERNRVWHVTGQLDAGAMSRAARSLLGRHDFAAFASKLEKPEASTVRELTCFDVRRDGDRLTCDVRANAFLPHQVRRMVGAVVDVGRGKLSSREYEALLKAPAGSAGPAAPPQGLYLAGVRYAFELFNSASAQTAENQERVDSEAGL